jgi:hypothetical protein
MAQAARFGKGFEARGDVHAVAEDVVAVDDDVPDIDTDAKSDPLLDRQIGVAGGHTALDIKRAAHRIDRACELDQHPVAGRLDDAPAMLGDFRVNKLSPACLQQGESALLIGTHQAAITCDVGGQDGRQPSLDALVGQEAPFEKLRHDTIGPKLAQSASKQLTITELRVLASFAPGRVRRLAAARRRPHNAARKLEMMTHGAQYRHIWRCLRRDDLES